MRSLRFAAALVMLAIVATPLSTSAAIKYGPDAAYRRGAPGEPCFFSRHAIQYDQGGGGVVKVYRSHFWVYVSNPSASLNYKHSIGEWDNWTNPKLWSGPWDYPLPLTSSNTPTWIYEYYAWAGHSWAAYGNGIPGAQVGFAGKTEQVTT